MTTPDSDSRWEYVEAALRQLANPCRDIIVLHKIEGYPLDEVAGKVGLSYGTVRNKYSGCFEKLVRLVHQIRNREENL